MSVELEMSKKGGDSFTTTTYGSTHHDDTDTDVFGDSQLPTIDSLKSEDESDIGLSCSDCCKKAPMFLYNITLGACFGECGYNYGRQHSELHSSQDDADVASMKERLKYHFMNPFERWNAPRRRQFPWKLVVQLLSIILVTAQLVMFANSRFTVSDFLRANKKTFIQLFMLRASQPIFSNPIPLPIRVIYTNDDLFEQLNHTASQYFHLDQVTVGPYGYQWDLSEGINHPTRPHLHIKIRHYESGEIDPSSLIYQLSTDTILTESYFVLNTSNPIDDAINWTYVKENLPGVVDIHMDLSITSASIGNNGNQPQCSQFNISLLIVNDHAKGMMPINMNVVTKMRACNRSIHNIVNLDSFVYMDVGTMVVDSLVILISVISIFLCVRSLIYSVYLCSIVRAFFIRKFNWRLRAKHFLSLFHWWFVMIIVSNILVVAGTIMKIYISHTNPDSPSLVDATSIILGIAVFGQWCGLLRFLSYFDKYNMLLITLRLAMPSVLRFGVCVGILYVSFLLLGWLVLGPYHPKFRDTTVTSECLFALLNGDDVFNTYAQMAHVPVAVWVFSKFYIYLFVSLFIYIVLSVVISLISDTYETLNDVWGVRRRGLLMDFATDQLARSVARARPKLGSLLSRRPSLSHDGVDDYDILRDKYTHPSSIISETAENIEESPIHTLH